MNRKISKFTLNLFRKGKPGPRAYTLREKIHNCTWVFTIGDADDHPSIPHGLAQEKGYRLDAWTGKIYPAGNERVNYIDLLDKKELGRLHKDSGFLKFAEKQVGRPFIATCFTPDMNSVICTGVFF